jgi:hypothetical protein
MDGTVPVPPNKSSGLLLAELVDEPVVFFVRADPEPHHQIAFAARQRTIMISDPDGPNVRTERLELHRRVKWIALPKAKLISRETLNVRRQPVELVPEPPVRPGFHGI